MSKTTRSLLDQLAEMQAKTESLERLGKMFDKYLKSEFGYGASELHEIVRKYKNYENKMKERNTQN